MLPQAPVLTPSSKEWSDPHSYIISIKSKYEKYGIIKIIPPTTWKPDFCLLNLQFKTRMQNLSDLNGISRSSKNYFGLVRKFHAQNGIYLNKIPIVDKVPIDLLHLSKIIKSLGGYSKMEPKSWKKVALELGYQTEYLSKWTAKGIQGQYEKWIKPFEEYTNPKKIVNTQNLLQEKNTLDGLEFCKVCQKGHDEEKMLLCDGCNQGWHLYCLEPKMSRVPETDWFCGKCLKEEDFKNFGFDDGNTRKLLDFEFIAAKFKQDWFYKKFKSTKKPTSSDIEHEFWKLVNSVDDIEVEYGADLHSSHHGSGFPTFERNPKNKYSKCTWNLNNLPIIGKSVFRHIKSDISGMIVPWLYVGMVFSAFCWHTEDHYTYSINYLHWGDQKTWYGIPSFDADKFEKVMKVMMPELFEANPDLLFHLTTMLSPLELIARGVSVFTIDQSPGEFVITFPRAYHAGFNQGYNFAEAVNFALPDWFGYGRKCIERYSEYSKNPVFCHDELLLATIHSDLDPENAEWLSSDLKYIMDKTISKRLNLIEEYGSILTIEEIEYQKHDSEPILQCFKCRAFCYMNTILCKCNPIKVSCEIHVKEVIQCSCHSLILKIRLSNDDLIQLQEKVDSVAAKPVKWSDQLQELLRQNERPHIHELNRLLAIAELSGDLLDEMIDLKAFVNEANFWIENITRIFGKRKAPRKSEINPGLAKVDKLFGPERTLSNFYLLLAKAHQMTLECPEVHILKEAIAQAEQYRERSASLLKDSSTSLKDLNDLYKEGIDLEIGVEELFDLEDKIRLVQWEESAKNLLSRQKEEIKPFTEMIRSGLDMGITQNHPQMVALKNIKSVADEWRDHAHNILRLSKLNISSLFEIKKILLDGKSTPYYKATMQQLEQLCGSINIWYKKASEIFEILEKGDKLMIGSLKTQNYEQVKDLLIESEALSMSLEIPEILEIMALTEAWLQRGKKALCRPRSSKTFQMILSDLLKNVEVFANTNIPGGMVCFCRMEVKDQSLIVCLDCNHAYHTSCLGITKKMKSNITDFKCFVCSGKFDAMKRDGNLPSLEKLQAYLSEGQSLSLVPQEVQVIEKIVEKLVSFKKFVFEFLAKNAGNDKFNLKELIRSSAGLDVLIDPEMAQLRKRAERMQLVDYDSSKIDIEDGEPRYCICREVYTADKPMIGCDQCSEWYHWECLGLNSRNVDALRDVGFICTICSTANTSKKKTEKHPKVLFSSDSHNKEKVTQIEQKNSSTVTPLGEIENDDEPVKVFKVPFIEYNFKKRKLSTLHMVNETLVDLLGSNNAQETEYDELLPPPPSAWSVADIEQHSSGNNYRVPSFLYSPFAIAANTSNWQDFIDE